MTMLEIGRPADSNAPGCGRSMTETGEKDRAEADVDQARIGSSVRQQSLSEDLTRR